jgi:hypothetical protein
MGRAWLVLLVSSDVGVERPGLVGGGRVGTLLGPEASGPLLERLAARVWGSGGSGSSLCFAAPWGVVGGWWGCCLRSA